MKENENFSNFGFFENQLNFYVIFIPTFLNTVINIAKLTFLDLKLWLRHSPIVTLNNKIIKLKRTCLNQSADLTNKLFLSC